MTKTKEEERPLTIVVAMAANLTIAIAKFVVAALSASAALFAEGVHSVVDTLNQGLLLVGAKRSHRVADQMHPFGYGKEIYFWSLIYSVLLLGIGGGVSVFKGVNGIIRPSPLENHAYTYAVLGVAFLAEGASWVVAVRAIVNEGHPGTVFRKLKSTSDPSRFVVLGEDSAALVGLVIAFVGVFLSQVLKTPIPDAIASILIGVVLCAAAVALISKTKTLVIGRAAEPEVVRGVNEIIEGQPDVVYVRPPLTMQLGPEQAMVAVDIRFRDHLSADDVARAVDRLELAIRDRFPQLTRIYIEPQALEKDVDREQPPQRSSSSSALEHS